MNPAAIKLFKVFNKNQNSLENMLKAVECSKDSRITTLSISLVSIFVFLNILDILHLSFIVEFG